MKNIIKYYDLSKSDIDSSKGLRGAYEGKGNKEKIWVKIKNLENSNDNLNDYLFKESNIMNQSRYEFLSEVIASKLINLKIVKNIEVPQCYICRYKDNFKIIYGTLIKSFLENDYEYFVDGYSLYTTFYPGYNGEKGESHSVKRVLEVLQKSFKKDEEEKNKFLKYLIFDILIANGDRHQSNWGIITRRKEKEKTESISFIENSRLAPAFDNGSSLFREIKCNDLEKTLGCEDKLSKYFNRGKPSIGFSSETNKPDAPVKRYKNHDFLKELNKNYCVKDLISNVIQDKNFCLLDKIKLDEGFIQSYSKDITIPDENVNLELRLEFMKKIIKSNYKKLLNLDFEVK